MRWLIWAMWMAALAGPAGAEDIIDVLHRSQQQRLALLKPAPAGERSEIIKRSFDALRQGLGTGVAANLLVVTGPTYSESLHGRIVVANVLLADLPEAERVFMLAHELGHVTLEHWLQFGRLYKRFIPGAVTPKTTDPVAEPLSREASALSHRQEFEADLFALQALRDLGWPPHQALTALTRMGMRPDTATHPATRKRIGSLRAAMAGASAPAISE